MTKEEKFYNALRDIFIGAKIEGTGGFINLMKIKSKYYSKIEELLKADIERALEKYPSFRDELFDKLYTFFNRYFTESGSIYFNSTPFHNNVYERVYTNDKDVVLFWKTQMLYYVKTDRIFRSMPVEFDNLKFFFDASTIENKKANEKRNLIYELKEIREDNTIVFNVFYSERGRVTKIDEILKVLKKKNINIDEERLEKSFRIFEKQSEVDFFINKNAKSFLQEQFKLWSYQYFWEGTPRQTSFATPLQEGNSWSADRVNELQILKDIAFKIIEFISQFEDELVKIWNKPKFVKNSNYVITLDRIDALQFPSYRGDKGVLKWYEIPYNPNLKEKARELRKAGNLAEVLFWKRVRNRQFLNLDFDRQKIVGNYIVDFYIKEIGVVVEIDGSSHNDKEEYDKARDEYLKSLGLKVIHIKDEDVKNNLDGVMEYLREVLTPLTPLQEGKDTPLAPLQEGNGTPLTPLQEGNGTPLAPLQEGKGTPLAPLREGNLVERILKHPNIDLQIQEWRELGIVDENFTVDDVFETDLTGKHIAEKYKHLPIDTKYFKDLELEILSLFDDLDNSLDGWLIKSENYQALNTILPKFKEKVQTIYIDPPFNLDSSDQFLYRTNYKDANWATLLENRLRIAKDWLNEKGSIFVRCDYNGNWIVRCVMDEVFGKENFRNEIFVKRGYVPKGLTNQYLTGIDSIFFYAKDLKKMAFKGAKRKIKEEDRQWISLDMPGQRKTYELQVRYFFGEPWLPPKGQHWGLSQQKITEYEKLGWIRINPGRKYIDTQGNEVKGMPEYLKEPELLLDTNWTDIKSYETHNTFFATENSEILLKRVIEGMEYDEQSIVIDFFLGSGTTTSVAHKLGRKWIGIEMGEHFYTVVLPRMKKVLAYDKSGISKEVKEYQGGGFFKYYELEQYEETLANTVYENHDVFIIKDKNPYEQYVFMKDEKMLRALEIDYENKKVKVDLSKLYENIDIAETLSNLTGKWIKRITPLTPLREGNDTPLTPLREGNFEVEFEDGTKINTKDLDYKLIKPLIWWE